jgi:hypothetical protein
MLLNESTVHFLDPQSLAMSRIQCFPRSQRTDSLSLSFLGPVSFMAFSLAAFKAGLLEPLAYLYRGGPVAAICIANYRN